MKKTKPITVVHDSDLLLLGLHALLSFIPTQDSLGTTVYFDMWNSSHTHIHIDTNAHSSLHGGYKLGIASGNDIMRQAAVNTLDW